MRNPTEFDIPIHGWSPYSDVHQERIAAHQKHGAMGNSRENASWDDREWLPILMEEVGEVAHWWTYDSHGELKHLRKELIQVAAMAIAWIESIDEVTPNN
jgi:NTP pyrophosphatase (non-canonical NTP hydrolase)